MYNNQCEAPNSLYLLWAKLLLQTPEGFLQQGMNETIHGWLNPAPKLFFTDYWEGKETGICEYTLKISFRTFRIALYSQLHWGHFYKTQRSFIYGYTVSQNLPLYNSEWWFVTKRSFTPFSPLLNTDKGSKEVCYLLSFSSLIIQSYVILEQNLANSVLFPVPKKKRAVRNVC